MRVGWSSVRAADGSPDTTLALPPYTTTLHKISELGNQRYILRLQLLCAAKLFTVPK